MTSLAAMLFASCNAQPNLSGGIAEDSREAQDSENVAVQPKPGVAGPSATSSSTAVNPIESELSIPIAITGAFLVCMSETLEKDRGTVACSIRENASGKKVDLKAHYTSYAWSTLNTTTLVATQEALDVYAKWHVRFSIAAKTVEELAANIQSLRFNFDGTDT